MNIPINAFNAGELTPYLAGRCDLEKFSSGCRTLLNMRPLCYGGAQKRRGFEFIAPAKYRDKPCRLVRFQFSTGDFFLLEMGQGYVRFFKNGAPVLAQSSSGETVPLEVQTPYLAEETFALQWVQSNDVVFFAHPNHPPQKLSRYADDNWVFEPVAFDWPPLLDVNVDETIRLSASAASGEIVLSSSADLFSKDHEGACFALEHPRSDVTVTGEANALKAVDVKGSWTLGTSGIWSGVFKIERCRNYAAWREDPDSEALIWEPYRSYTSSEDRNLDISGEEEERVVLRMNALDVSQGEKPFRWELNQTEYYRRGLVEITEVVNAKSAKARVLRELGDSPQDWTDRWYEGAWSRLRGYPAACAFFQQRLFFGGSAYEPQTIWGSRIDDYENFEIGPLDTDGLRYVFASEDRNAIVWMCALDEIAVGTTGGEWRVGSTDYKEPLTPSNVRITRQSTYGSGTCAAQVVNDSVVFAQRGNRRLRQYRYALEKDGYVAPDLTLLAEHITGEGIVDMAYQQHPESVLWCVRKDGDLAALTYEADQNVTAWSRHATQGKFLSIEAVASALGDELWAAVRRTLPDGEHVFIERAQSENTLENTYSFVDRLQPVLAAPRKVQIAAVVSWEQLSSYAAGSRADSPMCQSSDTMGGISDSYREWAACCETLWPGKCQFALILYTRQPQAGDRGAFIQTDFTTPAAFLDALEADYDWSFSGTPVYRAMQGIEKIAGLSWDLSLDTLRLTMAVTGYGYGSQETYDSHQTAAADRALSARICDFCYMVNEDSQHPLVSTPFESLSHAQENPYAMGHGTKTDGTQILEKRIVERVEKGGFACIKKEVDFLDCSKTFRGEALREIDGLEHLEGLEVSVVADGVYAGTFTVENGKIDLGFAATDVRAGLPYAAEVETLSADAAGSQGSTQTLKRQLKGAALRFYRSGDCLAGDSSRKFEAVVFRDTGDFMDECLPPYTGVRYVDFDSSTARESGVVVRGERPLPLTVLSVVAFLT